MNNDTKQAPREIYANVVEGFLTIVSTIPMTDWDVRYVRADTVESGEAVGTAVYMPGTEGFTMCAFKSADVPVGTELYAAHPPRSNEQTAPNPSGVIVQSYCLANDRDVQIDRVRQTDGTDLWAVRSNAACLNKLGEWEYEPMPSNRDEAFLSRCRFETAEAAIEFAKGASK